MSELNVGQNLFSIEKSRNICEKKSTIDKVVKSLFDQQLQTASNGKAYYHIYFYNLNPF